MKEAEGMLDPVRADESSLCMRGSEANTVQQR
jgi:hypothetical protein